MCVGPGEEVNEGMIVGENARADECIGVTPNVVRLRKVALDQPPRVCTAAACG